MYLLFHKNHATYYSNLFFPQITIPTSSPLLPARLPSPLKSISTYSFLATGDLNDSSATSLMSATLEAN